MVTYKTLEVAKENVEAALEKVEEAKRKALEDWRHFDKQEAVIAGQLIVLNQLMDIENNPPTIEIPMAEEKIEEMFERRLEGPPGVTEEELHRSRQDVYLQEALDVVEQLDALNKESSGENAEEDS